MLLSFGIPSSFQIRTVNFLLSIYWPNCHSLCNFQTTITRKKNNISKIVWINSKMQAFYRGKKRSGKFQSKFCNARACTSVPANDNCMNAPSTSSIKIINISNSNADNFKHETTITILYTLVSVRASNTRHNYKIRHKTKAWTGIENGVNVCESMSVCGHQVF